MSSFTKKALLEIPSPLLQFKRFRGKINVQRPRTPHYDRALFNAVTRPVYKSPSLVEECAKRHADPRAVAAAAASLTQSRQVDNPYERIIAKEVTNWFDHSRLVAIFHNNSITSEEMFKVRVQFFKQNMHLKSYSKSIMKLALTDTKYAAVLPLFESKNCIVFAPEQKLPQLLRIAKRVPQLVLLAGICEERLMSRTQLSDLAALPSLDIARAQLVGVLQQAAGNQIVQHLQAHQTQLCSALDAYAQTGAGGGDGAVATEAAPAVADATETEPAK